VSVLNIGANVAITLDAAITVGSLAIGDLNNTHSYTISNGTGGSLTFNNGSSNATLTQISTSRGDTSAASMTLGTSLDVTNLSTNRLTLSGSIALNGNTLTLAAGTGNFNSGGTALSAISGTGSIVTSSGYVRLNNAAPSTASFTVNGGTLSFASGSAPAGNIAVNGGATLVYESGGSTSYSGNLTGAGTLAKGTAEFTSTAGTLTLAGNNSGFTGTTVLNFGAVSVGSSDNLGATNSGVTFSGGTLRVTAASGFTSLGNRTLTFTSGKDVAFDITQGIVFTLSNNLTQGAGGLVKSGHASSTLSLTGSNTFTGNITVNGGKVALDGINSINGAPGLVVNSGGIVSLGAAFTGGTATVSSLSGAGTVDAQSGAGVGTRTLNVNQSTNTTFSGNLTDAASLSRAFALTKSGAGTLTLSGTGNTYTGGTTIGAGVLSITNGNAIANTGVVTFSNVAGAALEVNSSETIGSLRGGGSTGGNVSVASGQTLTVAETGDQTFAGAITNSGGFTKTGAGTTTLTGANTYSGDTAISNGVLKLNATTGSALASTASVSVTNGATLLIAKTDQVNNAATVTLSGGTIKRDGTVSEVFGNLNLTEASFLDYGTGAAGNLTFGTYAPSALLTVQNFSVGNTLKFGSSMSSFLPTGGALTNSHFSFNNAFTYNDTNFTITAIPEPSTYVAAIGLLALMLWPLRRRKCAKVS
jgi:autotransporter-associated beta strand protein